MSKTTPPSTTTNNNNNNNNNELEPRRLELSVLNGALQTAPLLHVVLTATDGLYRDLYQMTAGEIEVAATQNNDDDNNNNNTTTTTTTINEQQQQQTELKRERMADLAFAQRRHELAWRLARHAKTLEQVAALTAAAATTDLAETVQISSQALQHARTAWVQADEAQDALYFFHAQLFPMRAPPHDILGAADVQLNGMWYDMAKDMQLQADPYETSVEASWTRSQVDDVWQMAVRRKAIVEIVAAGWIGAFDMWESTKCGEQNKNDTINIENANSDKKQQQPQPKKEQYPIAAVLTVVPSGAETDEWTLLSLDVHVQAKTGEFNYQLECSNRQKYDLHRLAALAMSRAEAKARKLKQEAEDEEILNSKPEAMESSLEGEEEVITPPLSPKAKEELPPARPLDALFQVAHTFQLSWQLEVLSAQALGLRRGAWGAVGIPIQVQPVQFMESSSSSALGVLSIYFWKIDDSYGPPSVGQLLLEETELDNVQHKKARHSPESRGQLVLTITAECAVGIQVSLSGAKEILAQVDYDAKTKSIVQDLLEATANPFALSASDALLAAARLLFSLLLLPNWIALSLDRGSIVAAAKIKYYSGDKDDNNNGDKTDDSSFPILFRIQCDLRTGSFVPTFPRPFHLLSTLAGADSYQHSSELMAMRVASLPPSKRRAAGASSTGRCVREAFDGLMRSMNLLGQRVGVGGSWDDTDPNGSPKLRQRAIQGACVDVRTSLTKCCAMAALYGLAPLAVRIAFGLDAGPDMAGTGTDKRLGDMSLLLIPPLSIRLHQELIEETVSSSDGVPKRNCHLEQILFSLSCRISDDGVILVPLEVSVQLDSPAAEPIVKEYELLQFETSTTGVTASSVDNDGTKVGGILSKKQDIWQI